MAVKARHLLRRFVGRAHLWLGLASGLIVFVLGVTGAAYAFIDEIKPIVYRRHWVVEPLSSPRQPLTALLASAQAAAGPAVAFNSIEVDTAPDRAWAFTSMDINPKAKTFVGEFRRFLRVYVNPYTGAVLKVENAKHEFFFLVLSLHYSLFLSMAIGKQIVGAAVLIFVLQLAEGIYLWWPKNLASLKHRLKISFAASPKRVNYALHNVLGFYAAGALLLIAFTGLTWAYPWFSKAVATAVSGHAPIDEKPAVSGPGDAASPLPLEVILADALARKPDAAHLYLGLPAAADGAVSVYATPKIQRHFQSSDYDRYSGRLLHMKTYAEKDRGEKLNAMTYSLHVGSILGLPGKILAFTASVIAASLPVTGFLIWWTRRKNRARQKDAVRDSMEARV